MAKNVRVPYFLDEPSLIGLALSFFTAAMIFTWYQVDVDLGFRGLFFLAITGAGMGMYLVSGRVNVTMLVRQWQKALVAIGIIILGIVVTALLQTIILQAPLTVLTGIPAELQKVYLAEAALSETFFVFGMYTLFAGRIHPIVGIAVVALVTPYLHLYVYGSSVAVLWAVSASFVSQALAFEFTRLFSVPMGIHLGWNLL